MLGFGKKKCFLCNEEIKEKAVEKDGKKFCSEKHIKEFEDSIKKTSQEIGKGCCNI